MLKRYFAVLFLAVATLPALTKADDGPSYALVQSLAKLQTLNDSEFFFVTQWAANPSQPGGTAMPWEGPEAQLWSLGTRDRDAVLSWLTGNGRSRLYARGATDSMIGPKRSSIDDAYSPPTPSPAQNWRKVPFVAGTMNGPSPANISIVSGWSMIKRDATAEVHCISFVNTSPKAANEITFSYQFLDSSSNVLASLKNVRAGTFSSNVKISGPEAYANYLAVKNGQQLPRSLLDNCWSFNSGTAQLPLLQSRYITFTISSVKYSDGTVWNQTSP